MTSHCPCRQLWLGGFVYVSLILGTHCVGYSTSELLLELLSTLCDDVAEGVQVIIFQTCIKFLLKLSALLALYRFKNFSIHVHVSRFTGNISPGSEHHTLAIDFRVRECVLPRLNTAIRNAA